MSTSLKAESLNRLLEKNRTLVEVTTSPTSLYILYLIKAHRGSGISLDEIQERFSFEIGTASGWLNRLIEVGLVKLEKGRYFLTALAERRLALADVSLENLCGNEIPGKVKVDNKLPDWYKLESILGKGATSVTFRALQNSTKKYRTVKVFRPGLISFEQLEKFREKRAQIPKDVAIPDIIGTGQFRVDLEGDGNLVKLCCQVFQYENDDAETLHEYVNRHSDLPVGFFRFFIEHVGGALAAIERVELQHGDLHARNILVIPCKERRPSIAFRVIDFAGGSSFNTLSFSGVNDLEMFKRHLIWCLAEAASKNPELPARQLVGSDVLRVIRGLRKGKYKTFKRLLKDYYDPSPYEIPDDFFKKPPEEPFGWLRVEMIQDIRDLYKLFEPEKRVFREISGPDNVFMSGPRGCGKSHYLRVFSFWPEIEVVKNQDSDFAAKLEKLDYDYEKRFGVLFECRVGEFKNFIPKSIGRETFDYRTFQVLKHILVLKIINKTLTLLRDGCESGALKPPENITALRAFIQDRFTIPVDKGYGALDEMIQYTRALVTKEKQAEFEWQTPDKIKDSLLYESDLDLFFGSLKKDFPNFSRETRFYVLFDDASEDRIHPEMQKVLNSLVTSAGRNHCFKVTFDLFKYTLETIEDRNVILNQDVLFFNIGDLSLKSGEVQKRLREYVRKVVNTRLNSWVSKEKKTDIVTILGESQRPRKFLRLLRLPRKRGAKKSDSPKEDYPREKALYAGWNIIWQLSHGSIRTLFQLLDKIFAYKGFNKDDPKPIPLEDQDKIVRDFSNYKYQSLLMAKGSVDGQPLGEIISNVARTIGQISRLYLTRYETEEPGRYYETISLERLDLRPLGEESMKILESMLENDVLIGAGLNFTRSQVGLSQRYDLNKIYAPAFRITYRVRNHLYLSRGGLERLLLSPDMFIRRYRWKLERLVKPKRGVQLSLFGGD